MFFLKKQKFHKQLPLFNFPLQYNMLFMKFNSLETTVMDETIVGNEFYTKFVVAQLFETLKR